MSEGFHISGAWRDWLETQTPEQLRTSMDERMQQVRTLESGDHKEHLLREIGMIESEIRRREEAERVRAQFFPRVTLRNMKDAQLLAQLLHAHAQEVLALTQQTLQYKRLADSGFPLSVQFYNERGEVTSDIDAVLQDLGNRAIYAAELLGAVSEEMLRLRDTEGVELTEKENEAFGEMVKLVEQMKEEEK